MNTKELIEPYLQKPTILVFEDEQVKKSFIRSLQDKFSFHAIKYITFEELKQFIYLQDTPVLKGEKRVVALDNALSSEIKKFFNLHDYLDVSVFSSKFFDFFEILQEASSLDLPDSFFESTADSENQLSWQITSNHQLVLAKKQYLEFINKAGYVDEIFIDSQAINMSAFLDYEQFVFVGVNRLSKREQFIVERLREEKLVFEVDSGEGLSFKNNNLQELTINRCSDSFGQLVHCASNADRDSFDVIVDLANDSISYAELFDLEMFELKYCAYFPSSRVFSVLKNLELLVGSWAGNKIDGFRLEEACSNDDFCRYYQISKEDINNLRESLNNNKIFFPLFKFSIKKLEADMVKINALTNVDALVEFIQGLDLSRLLESSFDTVLDKLFGQLFSLQKAFNSTVSVKKSLKGIEWLKLVLKRCEHLKLEYVSQKGQDKKLRIVDWTKSWFLENKRIILLNANENVLSGLKHKPFLFTEKQLKALGAVTRDERNKIQHDRFIQLCLRNKQVRIYSIESASEGKQTSSFVEELVMELPADKVTSELVIGDNYYGAYLAKIVSDNHLDRKDNSNELIDVTAEDIGEAIVLSPTSFDSLKACPLKYYLDKVVSVQRRKLEESIDIKDNVLGNVVHDVFEEVCVVVKRYIGQDISYATVIDSIDVAGIISTIFLKSVDMLPEVYRQNYAEQVIAPVLVDSIRDFFIRTCGSKFELKDIVKFYIEDEGMDKNDKLQIGTVNLEGQAIPIKIFGRADLRLELKDGRVYVFDFKTGSTMNDEQLSFYSEYYYEGREGGEEVKPHLYFYQVFDKQEKLATKLDIKSKIQEVVSAVIEKKEYDFAATTNACRYCENEGICRKNG
jgi:hypothetical protein